jgi:hypothetical protein
VKVKDLIEVALLYVGVPAVALYPLGFVGLMIQLWRDDFFPYQHFNTIWNAVALVPHTVVIGTGIELLYLSLVSTPGRSGRRFVDPEPVARAACRRTRKP